MQINIIPKEPNTLLTLLAKKQIHQLDINSYFSCLNILFKALKLAKLLSVFAEIFLCHIIMPLLNVECNRLWQSDPSPIVETPHFYNDGATQYVCMRNES